MKTYIHFASTILLFTTLSIVFSKGQTGSKRYQSFKRTRQDRQRAVQPHNIRKGTLWDKTEMVSKYHKDADDIEQAWWNLSPPSTYLNLTPPNHEMTQLCSPRNDVTRNIQKNGTWDHRNITHEPLQKWTWIEQVMTPWRTTLEPSSPADDSQKWPM